MRLILNPRDCARGTSRQELAETPLAVALEPEGLCARGTSPLDVLLPCSLGAATLKAELAREIIEHGGL